MISFQPLKIRLQFFILLTLWLPILVAFLGVLLFVFLLNKVIKAFKQKISKFLIKIIII